MISIEALHPLETGVLLQYDDGIEFDAAAVSRDLSLKPGQANQAFSWLSESGVATRKRLQSQGITGDEVGALTTKMPRSG